MFNAQLFLQPRLLRQTEQAVQIMNTNNGHVLKYGITSGTVSVFCLIFSNT